MASESVYKVEIQFNSGANSVIPQMGEDSVALLNFQKGRNEIFTSCDPYGNTVVIDTAQVAMIRSFVVSPPKSY